LHSPLWRYILIYTHTHTHIHKHNGMWYKLITPCTYIHTKTSWRLNGDHGSSSSPASLSSDIIIGDCGDVAVISSSDSPMISSRVCRSHNSNCSTFSIFCRWNSNNKQPGHKITQYTNVIDQMDKLKLRSDGIIFHEELYAGSPTQFNQLFLVSLAFYPEIIIKTC